MTKNTKFTLIGMSVIVGMMGVVIGNHTSFEDDLEALTPTERKTKVTLSVLNKSPSGEKKAISEKVHAGDHLVFNISANLPIHVALLAASNQNPPDILLKNARIPPGKNKRLDSKGFAYTYEAPQHQENLKFCIIYTDNEKDLRKELLEPNEAWSRIPETQCTMLAVK